MKRLVNLLMVFAVLWFAPCTMHAETTAPPSEKRQAAFENLSGYEVTDENGKPLPPFSLAAYRAEFRYLRRICHKIDLAGPPVPTDGWTDNIPDVEWPFMQFCYFGYASVNLAKHDSEIRPEALAESRWLIEALQTPRLSGFMTANFGDPFDKKNIHASAFVHGHFLNLTLRYREVSGDARYDGLIHRVAVALAEQYSKTDQAILGSYKTMWWLTDNFPVMSALSRYDTTFKRNTSQIRAMLIATVKAHYLDPKTDMFCTFVDPRTKGQLQGPRGVSMMYGLHFLRDFAPEFAAEQYGLAKKHLVRPMLGLLAVREFPEGEREVPDVASGPLFLGFSPSASGFAIAAAAINGDESTSWQLAKASAMVGAPVMKNGELHYSMMPPVGQAVILFGKTCLLKSAERKPAEDGARP